MTTQPGFNQSGPIAPIVPGTVPLDGDARDQDGRDTPFGDAIEGATAGNGEPSREENEPTVVTPPDMQNDAGRVEYEDGNDRLLGDDRVVDFDEER